MRWLILLGLWFVQTGFQAGLQATAPVLPFIQAELQISRAQVGLLGSAPAVGSMLLVLPVGWLVDRFGVRLLLSVGSVSVGMFLFFAAGASSFASMYVILALQGAGVGLAATANTKAVVGWFTARTRGTAMGIKQTGTSMGAALAAAVLPSVALAMGWRYALSSTGLVIAAVGLLCFLGYRDHAQMKRERRSQAEDGMRAVLANRNVRLGIVAGVCFTTVQTTLSTYLVLYLMEVRQMEVTAAGALLALLQMSSVLGRIVLGLASDRFFEARRRGLMMICGLGSLATAIVTAVAGVAMPFEALLALMVVFGLFGVGWTGLFMILMPELAGKNATGRGAAAGIASVNAGYFVGPPIFGLLVDVSHSYPVGWVWVAFVAALGTWAMARCKEQGIAAARRSPGTSEAV